MILIDYEISKAIQQSKTITWNAIRANTKIECKSSIMHFTAMRNKITQHIRKNQLK